MDTDNKITEESNITGGEKDTLHNAGVDLAPAEEKKTEEFIDIDDAPAMGDDPDLKKIGLNFVEKENKEDLSLLKEKMDQSSLGASKPTAMPIVPASNNPVKSQTDTNFSDLEKEFYRLEF